MTAKIYQFPTNAVRLTREVLLPGKLIFDWKVPERAMDDLYQLWTRGEIGEKALKWAHKEIMERWEIVNARAK